MRSRSPSRVSSSCAALAPRPTICSMRPRARDAALQARVHSALTRAMGGDAGAPSPTSGRSTRERAAAAASTRTGLRDDIRLLAAGAEPTRDVRRAALERPARRRPRPRRRDASPSTRSSSDDAAAADQLLSDDRHNRRANLVNDAIRPLGVFSGDRVPRRTESLPPRRQRASTASPPPPSTCGTTIGCRRASARRWCATGRCSSATRRTGDAPRDRARGARPRAQARRGALRESVDLGNDALDADDLDGARYYLTPRARLADCGERAGELAAACRRSAAARTAAEEAGVARRRPPLPAQPAREPTTTRRSPRRRARRAGRHGGSRRERFRAAPSRQPARARRAARRRDGARSRRPPRRGPRRRSTSSPTTTPGVGRDARALLDGPDFGQLDACARPSAAHGATSLSTCCSAGIDGRTALYTAAQLGAAARRRPSRSASST